MLGGGCLWDWMRPKEFSSRNDGKKGKDGRKGWLWRGLKCGVDGRLMDMRFCKSLAVVLLGLGCAAAAQAQAGVYVGYIATRLSGMQCFDPQGQCSSTGGVVNPAGIQAGAYYDFRTLGPMRLGLDLRGGTQHSNKSATSSAGGNNATGLDTMLLGLRGSFHTRYSWLSPYAQVSAGYARSNATLPFGSAGFNGAGVPIARTEDNFLVYEGFAGADIHVFPMIDLRVIELGIGNMNRFGSSSVGDGPGSVGVMSIGAAIVFHLSSSK